MSGRRPEKALTAAFVRSAQEPGKCFDGHGLYLRVDPNGSRFWVQRIAIRGKRTELGLGSPSLVSLKEARDKALANRKMAREGGDPPQAKRAPPRRRPGARRGRAWARAALRGDGAAPPQAKPAASAVLTCEEAAREVHRMHQATWSNAKHVSGFLTS